MFQYQFTMRSSCKTFVVFVLTGLQKGEEVRNLKHYWYTSWPDQKTPDQAPPLLQLVLEVEEAMQNAEEKNAPVIVHCR